MTSKIFLDEIFAKITETNSLKKLKTFINQKDIKNSLTLIKNKKDRLLFEILFNLTGNFNNLIKKINKLSVSNILKKEIENIKKLQKILIYRLKIKLFLIL